MNGRVTFVRRWLPLFAFVVLTYAVSAAGSLATASSVRSWYPELIKPSWTPPSMVFGPVWTLLYALVAVVGWRSWLRRESSPGARSLPGWWLLQLGLNAAWSPAFFGLQNPLAGLWVIVPLWLTLVLMQVKLLRYDRASAWLWLPYLLWVSFAMALNFAIWRLN
jgi:translocator protein